MSNRFVRRWFLSSMVLLAITTFILEKKSYSSLSLTAEDHYVTAPLVDTAPPPNTTANHPSAASSTAPCAGKEWMLQMLQSAKVTERISLDTCLKLPTRDAVAALYGPAPIVYGLETCEQFRRNARQVRIERGRHSKYKDPTVRVAGLYNTGTNALALSLGRNLRQSVLEFNQHRGGNRRGVRNKDLRKATRNKEWLKEAMVVPWRKHVPPRFRDKSRLTQDKDVDLRAVLPIVLVRDPYWWIQSMCKEPYDVEWKRKQGRCPNIVSDQGTIHPVKVKWGQRYPMEYPSLTALWNEWIREYMDADFPRLIVRFEDQLFHAEQVMTLIGQCAGVDLQKPFQPLAKRAKNHGQSHNLLEALQKYSSTEGRRSVMDAADLEYVDRSLDGDLLATFGYQREPAD